MYKNNVIACILTLVCIMLIPSLGTAQTGDVKAAMATLKADTEKLGTPKVQGSDLYFGSTKVEQVHC